MICLNVNRPIPDFDYSNWTDDLTIHFSEMLFMNNNLKELHYQQFQLRDIGCQEFSEKLQFNITLTHLDLSKLILTYILFKFNMCFNKNSYKHFKYFLKTLSFTDNLIC